MLFSRPLHFCAATAGGPYDRSSRFQRPAGGFVLPGHPDYENLCRLNSGALRSYLQMVLRHLRSAGSLQFFAVTVNLHPYPGSDFEYSPVHWGRLARSEEVPDSEARFDFNGMGLVNDMASLGLAEFIYLSERSHKEEGPLKGQPHYQFFLAVRSLYGVDQEQIQASIERELFRGCFAYRVRRLHSFGDQRRFLDYVMKDHNRSRQLLVSFSEAYPLADGTPYLQPLLSHLKFVGLPLGGCGFYPTLPAYGSEMSSRTPISGSCYAHPEFRPVYRRHRTVRPPATAAVGLETFVYLFALACQLQGWYLYARSLYRKRPGSRSSYEFVGTLQELLHSGSDWFLAFLLKEFPSQTVGLQSVLYAAYVTHLEALSEHLFRNCSKLLLPLQLNHHLIEFANGIYNKQNGRFLRWRRNLDLLKRSFPFNCYLHLPAPLRTGTGSGAPTGWLKLLGPHFDSDSKLEDFCARFGFFLQGDLIQRRLLELAADFNSHYAFSSSQDILSFSGIRALFRLLSCPPWSKYFGRLPPDGGGGSGDSPSEKFFLPPGEWGLLVRFFEGSPLSSGESFRAQQILFLLEPVLLLIGLDLGQAMLPEDALKKRIQRYRFSVAFGTAGGQDVVDVVEKELPQILVHCNRLFLKIYGKRFRNPPAVWKHVSDPLQARLVRYGYFPAPEVPVPEINYYDDPIFNPSVDYDGVWVNPNDPFDPRPPASGGEVGGELEPFSGGPPRSG